MDKKPDFDFDLDTLMNRRGSEIVTENDMKLFFFFGGGALGGECQSVTLYVVTKERGWAQNDH